MKRGVIVWNTIDGFMQTEVPIGRFETWTAANAALEKLKQHCPNHYFEAERIRTSKFTILSRRFLRKVVKKLIC